MAKGYAYDRSTLAFLGEVDLDADPLRPGEFLVPAFSTTEAPPAVPEGQRAVWTGSAWTPEPIPSLPEPDLDLARADGERRICLAAGAARAAFVPPGAFQDSEYEETLRQAEAFLAGEAGPFPALDADLAALTHDPRLGRAVASLAEAADLVIYKSNILRGKLSEIRRIRLIAQAEVRQAASVAAIKSTLDALTFPTP